MKHDRHHQWGKMHFVCCTLHSDNTNTHTTGAGAYGAGAMPWRCSRVVPRMGARDKNPRGTVGQPLATLPGACHSQLLPETLRQGTERSCQLCMPVERLCVVHLASHECTHIQTSGVLPLLHATLKHLCLTHVRDCVRDCVLHVCECVLCKS